jgi:predicted O-linked N-acetylglucosamine transferase (SPINDLY family)
MDESTRLEFERALTLHKRGDLAAAEAAYRTLFDRASRPRIAHMLAVTLHQQQRSQEALPWFERASKRPSAAFHTNFASALLAVGRSDEAEAQSRLALAASPEHAGARLNLALALEAQQQLDEAAAEFAALEVVSEVAAAARRGRLRCEARLAQQHSERGRALALLDHALEMDGEDRTAMMQSALVLLECGEVAACVARLHNWNAVHPRDAEMHSLYLRCAQYAPEFDAAKLLEAHRRWATMHAAAAEFVAPRLRGDREPLRIGWLSPAFRNGPVATFLLATLKELGERGLAESILYNSSAQPEPSSDAFRAAAQRWEDVAALDDTGLVQKIRADGIDVLIDLAGHARGGRLAALSRRTAPMQVTWLDSFGTTGVDAIDFVLTDSIASPPGSESGFVERLLRLPGGRLCYLPPVSAQAPDSDARKFISLNHFAKLNEGVIAVWAELLRALPEWTLYLQARAGDDATAVAQLRERFEQRGVDPRRIECAGYAALTQALAAYRGAAIALDPFPFTGGVSSCDALWMGLPLVTWPRDTLISRQGASLLHALDCEQWIARDAKDYVAIACSLAGDAARRKRWSEIASGRVSERLADAPRFADQLIASLNEGWTIRAGEGFSAVSRPIRSARR